MTGLIVRPGGGPERPIASRLRAGLVSTRPWEYRAEAPSPGAVRAVLAHVDLTIEPDSELYYAVLPEFREAAAVIEERFAATAVRVDLRFDDGSTLDGRGLVDQHGFGVTAREQHESKTLLVEQWNVKRVNLASFAGRRVTAIEVEVAVTELADGDPLTGWLDAVVIRPRPVLGERPSDRVRTTRGTHSSMLYSRGNTLPAVGLPHGAMMATPVTRAAERHWLYAWHDHNDEHNRSSLQAFATTLTPSPWIGERAAFQVMPGLGGIPVADRDARALTFSHDNETDRAHLYSVTFDNGLVAELVPAGHSVAMRFTAPGDGLWLLFDQIDGGGGLAITADGDSTVVHGWVDAELERVPVVPRLFVHAIIDEAATDSGLLPQPGREGVTGFVSFEAESTVTVRLGTSFISLDQAAANLERELPSSLGFDAARDRAQRAWDDVLSTITVEGATDDQLITLSSNLYRLFLFPNDATEEVGENRRPAYASPFAAPDTHAADRTGLAVVSGALSVNNGYWDTYRTCWPALELFDPSRAGRLLDGFVQHYRDSGWTTRWSAPGHVDVMVGTSSDVIFADAAVKAIPGIDLESAYDSALRNASVPPPEPAVGRKGISTSLFTGYTSTSTWEGLSWSLEAAINDFGLHAFSVLMQREGPASRREEFAANATWFRSRALGYAALFDPAVGFFQGRDVDGKFRLAPEDYDPGIWGTDYTETNGWGMAFSVPHDGNGLAALYGGREGLARKLDEFFSTPEPGGHGVRGPYDYLIHEISEAKDIRMGMLALSNQPAHHIPAMYLFAGRPDRTQQLVRESLSRLWIGSEIGQGYPGDEDNGEMSAWWLFHALGFYPLRVGSAGYVLGAPLFPRATLRLPSGDEVVVTAESWAPRNVYVQSLTVDGEPWTRAWIEHQRLAQGARLHFVMGPEPSEWGSAVETMPPSLTPVGERPIPLIDAATDLAAATHSAGANAALAFDDSSVGGVLVGPGEWIEYRFAEPTAIDLYTVTLGDVRFAEWVLEMRSGGQVLEQHERGELFRWARQTRPFAAPTGQTVESVRLVNRGAEALVVHQIEFLTQRS